MSGKVNSSNQLSPSGVICWTDDEYKAYLTAWGCMPKGLIYRVTSATSDCIFVGSGADDVADEEIWCADFNPDVICDFTSVVDPTDSASILYCSGGKVMKAKWEDFFRNTSFDLPVLPDADCEIIQVAYAKDSNGLGALYQIDTSPIPQGYRALTKSVDGSFVHAFSFSNTDPFHDGSLNVFDGSAWREAFANPDSGNLNFAQTTFTVDEFCGLGSAGKKIQIETQSGVGYYIRADKDYTESIAPYQFGTAVTVNGTLVAINNDKFGLNTNGQNSFVLDTLEGNWTTDGKDMVVRVYFLLSAADPNETSGGAIGDTIEIDMAQVGVRMTVIN